MLNLKNLTYYCNSLKSERDQLLQTPGLDSDDYLVSRKRPNGKTELYIRTKNSRKERYVNNKLLAEAQVIAQKMIARKKLEDIIPKINAIENLLSVLKQESVSEAYLQKHPWLSQLLPQRRSNSDKMSAWKNEPYDRNMSHPEKIIYPTVIPNLFTRSKSESMIVSRLEFFGVPYHYDENQYIDGVRLAMDFICINVNTGKKWYWDHRGMLDDKSYIEKTLYCEGHYLNAGIISGINLIVTSETASHPLDVQDVDQMIQDYLL